MVPQGLTGRELIDTGTDKRYVRRDESGRLVDDRLKAGRSTCPDGAPSAKPNSGDRDHKGNRGK